MCMCVHILLYPIIYYNYNSLCNLAKVDRFVFELSHVMFRKKRDLREM